MLKSFFAAGADASVEEVKNPAAITTARILTPFLFTIFIKSLSGEFKLHRVGVMSTRVDKWCYNIPVQPCRQVVDTRR